MGLLIEIPLSEEGDGGEDGEGDEVAEDAEDDLVHADVEGELGDDVVAGADDLDDRHRGMRLQHQHLVLFPAAAAVHHQNHLLTLTLTLTLRRMDADCCSRDSGGDFDVLIL